MTIRDDVKSFGALGRRFDKGVVFSERAGQIGEIYVTADFSEKFMGSQKDSKNPGILFVFFGGTSCDSSRCQKAGLPLIGLALGFQAPSGAKAAGQILYGKGKKISKQW